MLGVPEFPSWDLEATDGLAWHGACFFFSGSLTSLAVSRAPVHTILLRSALILFLLRTAEYKIMNILP